ncbi:MAG: OadG family protein [Eubacterium sp.]|nr:OadG family protein [Eubacterium sp.]
MYQIALLITAKAGFFGSIDWAQVATVVLAGVGIVLGVLIVLIFVFGAFGNVVSKLEKSAKEKKAKKDAAKAAKNVKETPVTKTAPAVKEAPTPVIEQGISGEIVAAITAAVTACEGSNQFVIRSVKRKDVGSRNPWARAAVNDNTRSF